MKKTITSIFTGLLFVTGSFSYAQDNSGTSAEDLAKQLANPVANLISVAFQKTFDCNVGPTKVFQYSLNVQSVIPIDLSENWNLISRTILPFISQSDIFIDGDSQTGLRDIAQSIFFSPKEPTENGLIWGAGPILLLPIATNDAPGGNKWAAGPNAVFLKLQGAYTYGGLGNHMWSYAGDGSDISASILQPFVTYATPSGTSYTVASENTQSWKNDIFGGGCWYLLYQSYQVRKSDVTTGRRTQSLLWKQPLKSILRSQSQYHPSVSKRLETVGNYNS